MSNEKQTNAMHVELTINNSKGIDPRDFNLLRSDVKLFLTSLMADINICPTKQSDAEQIKAVFTTNASNEIALHNYLYLERDLGEIADVTLKVKTITQAIA